MDKNRTLIVGYIGLDTIEPVSDLKESILGGSATYATIAAGKSSSVHLVGIVGSDFPGNAMKIFEQSTVDLSNLDKKKGKTFRWGAKYASDWDNRETLFTELGVFKDFNPVLTERNKEVPVIFTDRTKGESKMRTSIFYEAFFGLPNEFLRHLS